MFADAARSLPGRVRNARDRVPALPSRVQSILGWAAIALVGVLVAGLVLAALAPRVLGIHFVIVAGGSMEPAIPFGSLAVMRDVDPATIEVGDIVLFPAPANESIVVTHRVVGFDEAGALLTQGDANARPDDWAIPLENVQREYLFAVPKAGSLVQWLGTPAGYFFVVLIPGLIIVGGEVRKIVNTVRHSRRKPAPADEPAASSYSVSIPAAGRTG